MILSRTTLPAESLLTHLKSIEASIGRVETFRNGPRVVDLDIIFYGDDVIDFRSDVDDRGHLIVPHMRMHEREFVLRPLCDVDDSYVHPVLKKSLGDLLQQLMSSSTSSSSSPYRVLPMGDRFYRHDSDKVLIAGILNVTPDRFH